jgi:hypothetical protein
MRLRTAARPIENRKIHVCEQLRHRQFAFHDATRAKRRLKQFLVAGFTHVRLVVPSLDAPGGEGRIPVFPALTPGRRYGFCLADGTGRARLAPAQTVI